VWFALASVLCGAAPNAQVLIAARAIQEAGAALLTPGSLAIIEASFRPGDRSKMIGAGPACPARPRRSARSSAAGWSRRSPGG
jgi:MFS family permease